MKEDRLIQIISESLPSSSNYIGDDTAFIQNRDLILTQDTLVEDVHFRRTTISAYELGIKSISVNLSDIAASGGIAEYLLISLSLPLNIDENFVREFYKGVNDICTIYNVKVVGGDITGSDKITISVSAIGKSAGLTPSKRSNAKPDDIVITTGMTGSSRAGLWLLETGFNDIDKDIKEKFIKSHTMPVPQLEIGRKIAEICQPQPTIMDTSDGLADALYKISKMSNVSMEIDAEKIPYDKDLKIIADFANTDFLNWVFFGGEDYQLVATVSEENYQKLQELNLSIIPIGKVIPAKADTEINVINGDRNFIINQKSIDNNSFDHFKGN